MKLRPSVMLFHASSKGDGSAMRMTITPACVETGNNQGHIVISIAKQASEGTATTSPRFDWEGRETVKLDIADIGEVLMVFSGSQESINGWQGLTSRDSNYPAVFKMRHAIEPMVQGCYVFEIETEKSSGKETRSFKMTRAEAAAVECAIKGALPKIAFGE